MKKIIVKDCMECPLIINCSEYKKLPKKAKFLMKTCPDYAGILKTCPLEDDFCDPTKLKTAEAKSETTVKTISPRE